MKKPASLYYVTIQLDGCSTVAIVRAYDVRDIRAYFGRIVVWDELDVSSNNEPDFDLTLPPSYEALPVERLLKADVAANRDRIGVPAHVLA